MRIANFSLKCRQSSQNIIQTLDQAITPLFRQVVAVLLIGRQALVGFFLDVELNLQVQDIQLRLQVTLLALRGFRGYGGSKR